MTPFRCSTLGQAPGLIHKHQTRLERLVRDKHSSLLQKSVNYGCKKFFSNTLCTYMHMKNTAVLPMLLRNTAKQQQCSISLIFNTSVAVLHVQTLAYRTSLWPSFQLQKWLHAHYALKARPSKTTLLKVENLAQTTSRFSPVSYCAPRVLPSN